MALTAGQIPKVANVPARSVATLVASSNTITMGADANGEACYTADATHGGRVESLTAVTDDAAVPPLVHVYILNGAEVTPLGTVSVPVSSGNTLAAKLNVDFLDGVNIVGLPIDNNGKRYIPLKGGDILKCGVIGNLTAAKACWVQGSGSNYQA